MTCTDSGLGRTPDGQRYRAALLSVTHQRNCSAFLVRYSRFYNTAPLFCFRF